MYSQSKVKVQVTIGTSYLRLCCSELCIWFTPKPTDFLPRAKLSGGWSIFIAPPNCWGTRAESASVQLGKFATLHICCTNLLLILQI